MICFEFVYCKSYFNLAEIFVLRLFKMVVNQSTPGLKGGLWSNFWRSANHIIFKEECVIGYRKVCLLKKKKKFTNGLNLGLLSWVWVKRESMEWKHTDSPVNKKFWEQQSVKKVMMIDSWNIKGPIIIGFLEKSATLMRLAKSYLLNDPCMFFL